MSESAANVKLFFIPALRRTAPSDTLQAAGAGDRALLGSNLSTDSGAKTRLGPARIEPQLEHSVIGIGISAKNPRGMGTESPE